MKRNIVLTTTCLLLSANAFAEHIEEMTVHGKLERVVMDKSNLTVAMPDTAELMQRIPGGGVNKNGALSGIPQYRGMYGSRVHVQADGLAISPGGPNWMDPPLHYAPAALLEEFTVFRGIAPVSAGQETIGGAIEAKTWQGSYAQDAAWRSQGRLYSGAQSNNRGWVTALSAALANHHQKIHAAALQESAEDQESANARLRPTEYRRQRYDLGISQLAGDHEFSVDTTRNDTDSSGTPALPMDILYIDGHSSKAAWRYQSDRWLFSAQASRNDIEHGMTNYHLRSAPGDMAKWRRNDTSSDTDSASFQLGQSLAQINWKVGIDYHNSIHNSDISNPNNAMFYVVNFNQVKRELAGLFAETELPISARLDASFGLRATQVRSDANAVDTSMAGMNAMVAGLRDQFNSADRSQSDTLYDATAKFYLTSSDTLVLYTGLARKSRAPSYQERYLWLPMQSTAGLADGNNHVGNIALAPEVAHEIELGFDFTNKGLQLSPRVFYKHIDDYIQGVPASDSAVINVSTMMGGDATPLRYANTSARIYGADLEARWAITRQWSLASVASISRGKRRDIDDRLYRITPDNINISAQYQADRWSLTLINTLVNRQGKVSSTNEEAKTPGYGLVSLHSRLQVTKGLTLALGVNNLLDKSYANHLGGYNRALNPDISLGERLPGLGRDLFARLKWDW